MLNGKTILITGGTGSFGNCFLRRVLDEYKPKALIIFSRDEKKQYDMRDELRNHLVRFFIGDVRDKASVSHVMKDVDYVFHAAALKQVPSCEFFPVEAIRTNSMGAHNVLDAAEDNGVKKVVVLSTDKAVYPINAMGMSKALMEKVMVAKARQNRTPTVFCGVRYGNVMFSRGSVIPLFVKQIQNNQPLTLTNPNMTRFLLPLHTAIDLVLHALQHGEGGDIFVRKSPAATMGDLAKAMCELFGVKEDISVIGTREGEKLHETLVTQEELMKAESLEKYFHIRSLLKLDYDAFFSKGDPDQRFPREGYNSENTKRLSVEDTKELLLTLPEIQSLIK